jgi:predicted transcriptional regulator
MRRSHAEASPLGIEAVLGPLAGRIMRVALTRGEVTVRDVADDLRRSDKGAPAYTTVMTIMARLHERGLLERVKHGRGFVYRPVADEQATIDELSRRAVDQLLATYGTSAMRQFAAYLADLEESEREELIRLAAGRRTEQ